MGLWKSLPRAQPWQTRRGEIGPPESIDPRDRRPKAFKRKEREEKNAKDAKKFANSGLGIGRQSR